MRGCELCVGAKPHVGVADGSVTGAGGAWGYACEHALPALVIGTFFEPRPCVACGFPTKNLIAGVARHPTGTCPRAPKLAFLGIR